jgi:hypothetical protein
MSQNHNRRCKKILGCKALCFIPEKPWYTSTVLRQKQQAKKKNVQGVQNAVVPLQEASVNIMLTMYKNGTLLQRSSVTFLRKMAADKDQQTGKLLLQTEFAHHFLLLQNPQMD